MHEDFTFIILVYLMILSKTDQKTWTVNVFKVMLCEMINYSLF